MKYNIYISYRECRGGEEVIFYMNFIKSKFSQNFILNNFERNNDRPINKFWL